MMEMLEKQGIISVNNKYEKAWNLNTSHKDLKDAVINFLIEERKKRFTYRISSDTAPPRYPNKLDYLILDEKDKPIDKKH